MLFRHRFVWFTLVFAVGFALWYVDHVNVTVALVHAVGWGGGAIRAAFAVAALLLVLAALIRTWAAAYLQTSVVHDVRTHTDKLVASGPYRYVRNPLYIGGLLLSVGMAMLASQIGAIVIVGGALAITLGLIGEEERQLTANQGESYAGVRPSRARACSGALPSA
jgi:protein-S-isoprenylcysteine O-methyltransferase Ste14